MNKRPVITVGMLILIGETAYLAVWKNLILAVVMLTAAMIIMMLEIKSSNRSGQKKCSYLLLFCCLAAGIGLGVVSKIQSRSKNLMRGENVSLEGKVVDVYEGEKSVRVTVKAGDSKVVVFIKGAGGLKKDEIVKGEDGLNVDETVKGKGKIHVGEYFRAEGVLETPEESTNPGSFDMTDYYSGKGIIGVIYTERYELLEKKDHVMYILGRFREGLEASLYRYFRIDRASFLSAMLLGDKSGLDRNQKLMYQKNGLAHILAISGMHVSIIALAFEKLLEMLGIGRKYRCAIVMLLIILYGLMTGFAPPIIRAVIMLVLRYYAFFIKRSADVPTDMMLALLIMAIINPESVFTAGLQLSFAAAGAMYISDRIYINYFGWRKIIFFTERYGMTERVNEPETDRPVWRNFTEILRKIFLHGKLKKIDTKRVKEYAARTALSTLVINMVLSPLLIYYYYEIYPYSMLLGIVIIPTAVYVIAGGFITALLGMIYMAASGGTALAAAMVGGPMIAMAGMQIGSVDGGMRMTESQSVFGCLAAIVDFVARVSAVTVNFMLGLYEKICNMGFSLPFSGINTGHTNIWVCGTFYIVLLWLTLNLLRKGSRINRRKNKGVGEWIVKKRNVEGESIKKRRVKDENVKERRVKDENVKKRRVKDENVKEQCVKGKNIIRLYILKMYGVLVMFLILVGYQNRKDDRIVVLDVGQGQSVIIHMSDGRNYILDGGSTSKDQVGEYVIIPALKYYGMSEITGVFVSHTDEDHINGLIEMSQMKRPYRLKIDAVYMAAGTKEDGNYLELGDASGVGVTGLSEGDVVGGCFTVIYPGRENVKTDGQLGDGNRSKDGRVSEAGSRSRKESVSEDRSVSEIENSGNDYSLVVLLDSDINGRELRILFPGDISSDVEERIIEKSKKSKLDISADILIAPHHGSKYSSSRAFLKEVSCSVAIISCGRNNPYGHPSPETLERMENAGCRIIRTDKDGAVVIE
ncbi:MAG: ComEC/Rec2 family competence protein [Eubacterium sp.]|nr:ComEC/Rec2 family competence protein [Eubacterium sp.]